MEDGVSVMLDGTLGKRSWRGGGIGHGGVGGTGHGSGQQHDDKLSEKCMGLQQRLGCVRAGEKMYMVHL